MSETEWNDRVAVITGASSGIGIGIAVEFAKVGCAVSLVGRNESNLKATAGKCMQSGLAEDKVLCIVADFLNDEDVKSVVTKTIRKFGKINVLINNAAMLKPTPLPVINMKDFDDIIRVNLRSVVLLTQETVPYLTATRGSIVNISSIVAHTAVSSLYNPWQKVFKHEWGDFSAYAMSKAALDHFTRCSAIDLAPKKVRINSIQPGVIDTAIWERSGMSREDKDQLIQLNASKHPMGRLGTPEDIGHMAVHLSSDKASFVNGQAIGVDGGFPNIF